VNATGDVAGLQRVRPIIRRLARWIGFGLLAIAILSIGVWCSVAVWYRCPAGEAVRGLLAAATLVFALVVIACLATPRRWLALAAYAASFALFLAWWATIKPTNDRNWASDVARTVTATIDGDRLVVKNVRNFTWRSDTDFDQRWEQRTYDLPHVHDVDLIMSYWAGEAIAHTIVSFGFDNGARLAFSIETRKESHESYSSIAGFFKQYELAVVAGDERDVVRVRSNVRSEDVEDDARKRAGAAARVRGGGQQPCTDPAFLQHADRQLHQSGIRHGSGHPSRCPHGRPRRLHRVSAQLRL
jgi:hypothetical protein